MGKVVSTDNGGAVVCRQLHQQVTSPQAADSAQGTPELPQTPATGNSQLPTNSATNTPGSNGNVHDIQHTLPTDEQCTHQLSSPTTSVAVTPTTTLTSISPQESTGPHDSEAPLGPTLPILHGAAPQPKASGSDLPQPWLTKRAAVKRRLPQTPPKRGSSSRDNDSFAPKKPCSEPNVATASPVKNEERKHMTDQPPLLAHEEQQVHPRSPHSSQSETSSDPSSHLSSHLSCDSSGNEKFGTPPPAPLLTSIQSSIPSPDAQPTNNDQNTADVEASGSGVKQAGFEAGGSGVKQTSSEASGSGVKQASSEADGSGVKLAGSEPGGSGVKTGSNSEVSGSGVKLAGSEAGRSDVKQAGSEASGSDVKTGSDSKAGGSVVKQPSSELGRSEQTGSGANIRSEQVSSSETKSDKSSTNPGEDPSKGVKPPPPGPGANGIHTAVNKQEAQNNSSVADNSKTQDKPRQKSMTGSVTKVDGSALGTNNGSGTSQQGNKNKPDSQPAAGDRPPKSSSTPPTSHASGGSSAVGDKKGTKDNKGSYADSVHQNEVSDS